MLSKFSKKRILVVSLVGFGIIAGGAYAYWTTTGSGSGSAAAGTNTAVTVAQVGTITDLKPGGAAQAVDYSITNSAASPQFVQSVTYTIAVTKADGAPAGTCDNTDFTVTQDPTPVAADIAPGTTSYSPSGATLAMVNKGTNQDACKLATIAITFTANAA